MKYLTRSFFYGFCPLVKLLLGFSWMGKCGLFLNVALFVGPQYSEQNPSMANNEKPLCELKSCSQKPCKHGGECKVQHQSFSCECEGTGYQGSECQKGFVTTPVFPKVSASSKSEALHLSARPSNKLTISLFAENGVTFYPSSYLEIVYPETKQKFFVESEKAGIQTITFDLGGPSVGDFEIPEPRFLLVNPRVMVNSSVYSKLFLPKGELPVGCNEYLSKSSSCELRFLSTEVWTGTSPSTKGIVHIKTPSNHYIPLSMVGLSLAKLQLSKKSLSQAVSARMSFSDAQNDFHIIDGMCIQRGLTFENRLELINDDALVSSFWRSFSRMSPKWLHIVTEEENNVFDIQNIAVNVAKKAKLNVEHCSVFPLNPSSSIVYIRPTAKYQFWVSDVAVFLSAEGDTCFAADVCKQSVFIRFPKRSASEINDRLAAFRDMKERGIDIKVDSLGLLESFDTHDVNPLFTMLGNTSSMHESFWYFVIIKPLK